jgi:hypothetical protein
MGRLYNATGECGKMIFGSRDEASIGVVKHHRRYFALDGCPGPGRTKTLDHKPWTPAMVRFRVLARSEFRRIFRANHDRVSASALTGGNALQLPIQKTPSGYALGKPHGY